MSARARPGAETMKRAISICFTIFLAMAGWTLPAHAGGMDFKAGGITYNVLLAGGAESNQMRITLSADGRSYVIDSSVPLEVGGNVCENPPENQNELICQAVQVSAFEVNADGGDDRVVVSHLISVPVTMRGGSGDDVLVGGSGPDKLSGGEGSDKLVGRDGEDVLSGGDGADTLLGGNDNDNLHGGAGVDILLGGPGENSVFQT